MSGSINMKEVIGPGAIGIGTSMQLTPALILQIIGILIALWGAWFTRKRWIESERANDIAEDRLKWEKEKHATSTNTQAEDATKDTTKL